MNYKYTTNPGYVDLIRDSYIGLYLHLNATSAEWKEKFGLFGEIRHLYSFDLYDLLPMFSIAILFTIARLLFNSLICRRMLNSLQLDSKHEEVKFSESSWKCLTYFCLWSYCTYILYIRYDFLSQPSKIWDDWSQDMQVPSDIKLLYFIEAGFYFHSVYATLYMDEKRKDYYAMLIHHVITLALIIFSYAVKFHKIGILVLFMHDVTDILLEYTKCHVYAKNRHNKFHAINDLISTIGFLAFTIAWFVYRLYWFPSKVLYTSCTVSTHRGYHRFGPMFTSYGLFNGLLWLLLFLDIYWFYYILVVLFKVFTGELSDSRELKSTDETTKKEKKS